MAENEPVPGRRKKNISRKHKGFHGENLACQELMKMGLKIIERNFKSPYGEVDIVVEHKEELIFIEVKYWDSFLLADLEYAVNEKKRRRIINTSLYFLEKNRQYENYALRYDVFFLTGKSEKYYIKNAFEGDGTPV